MLPAQACDRPARCPTLSHPYHRKAVVSSMASTFAQHSSQESWEYCQRLKCSYSIFACMEATNVNRAL